MVNPLFSVGDVSGSTTLTDNDHLYPAHVNETRTAINNLNRYNVRDYGAVGDGTTDDSVAIQAAFDAATTAGYNSETYFPPGTYLVNTTINLNGEGGHVGAWTVRGESRSASIIKTTTNIPIFKLDIDEGQNYYSTISDLGFLGAVTGTRTSCDAILFAGTGNGSTDRLTNGMFTRLMFRGVYCGIHSTRSTSASGENQMDFNLFTDILATNEGADGVVYGIKFDYGSGTGNVFSDMNLNCSTSCIEIGGTGDVNIGDLLFQGLHMSGATNAFKLVAGATAYHSSVAIVNCQMDANITNSLFFNGIDGFRVVGCNFGGATVVNLTNCSNYRIEGGQSGISESVYLSANTGITGTGSITQNALKLTLGENDGASVELISYGIIGGLGGAVTTSRYHVFSGTNAGVTRIDTADDGNGTALITHGASASGLAVTFTMNIVPTSAGSEIYTSARVTGGNYYYTDL